MMYHLAIPQKVVLIVRLEIVLIVQQLEKANSLAEKEREPPLFYCQNTLKFLEYFSYPCIKYF